MHICGEWVREPCEGNIGINSDETLSFISDDIFSRVQLNFHSDHHSIDRENFIKALKLLNKKFIFQFDDVNNDLLSEVLGSGVNVMSLFDTSSGFGILPEKWPELLPELYCGYAGGLGPDNLQEQLEKIESVIGDNEIWVDM